MSVSQALCAWSGGVKSCLAVQKYKEQYGAMPLSLITSFVDGGDHFRTYGLSQALVRAQSRALGVPLFSFCSTFQDHEKNFENYLTSSTFKIKHRANSIIFGHLRQEERKRWSEQLATHAGLEALHPLIDQEGEALTYEFLKSGFKARIISISDKRLSRDFLGKDLTYSLLQEIRDTGITVCGENSAYHTFVYDGPIFQSPIELKNGDYNLRDGHWYVDLFGVGVPSI